MISIGDMVTHDQFGIGEVVWINERRQSGHILVRPIAIGVTAKDTYVHRVRKLNALELLALEAA